MKYEVQIDLKMLPLATRNKIDNIVKRSGCYYSLENQVLSFDFRTMMKMAEQLNPIVL
jgi:hypothetical protein